MEYKASLINDSKMSYTRLLPSAPPAPSAPPLFYPYYPQLEAQYTYNCIFCKNTNNLFLNNICKCVYYYHKECFRNYVVSSKNLYTCPQCFNLFFVPPVTFLNHNRQLQSKETDNKYNKIRTICICLFILAIIIIILYFAFVASLNSWKS